MKLFTFRILIQKLHLRKGYANLEQPICFSVNVREIILRKNSLHWAAPRVAFHGAHTQARVSLNLYAMTALLSSSTTSSSTWMHGAQTVFAQMVLPQDAEQTEGSWLVQMEATLIPQANLGKAMLTIAMHPALRPVKDIGDKWKCWIFMVFKIYLIVIWNI